MLIETRKDEIVKKLKRLADRPDDKYRLLIELGKKLPAMDSTRKIESFLVPGCISKVWLFPYQDKEGRIFFEADSDAQIPKGMVALLLQIYNGNHAVDILNLDTSFLDELGLKQQLSYNRRNSLVSFVKQIRAYAAAFSQPAQAQTP